MLVRYVPAKIQRCLDAWSDRGFRNHNRPKTKIFQETIRSLDRLMRGSFFDPKHTPVIPEQYFYQPFTSNDFLLSLDNFHKASFDPLYKPSSKKFLQKITLVDFLYLDLLRNNENRSFFLQFFENPPELIHFPLDRYPDTVKALVNEFNRISGGMYEFKRGGEDHKNFVFASRKLEEFLKEHGKLIENGCLRTPAQKAELLFRSALITIHDDSKKINPYLLGAPWVIQKMAQVMYNRGYLKQEIPERDLGRKT